jgi:6-phosphogluconolactonase
MDDITILYPKRHNCLSSRPPIMPSPIPRDPVLHSFSSSAALSEALAAFIIKAQNESIENPKKGRFTVALSGGSLPKMLEGLVGNPSVKWHKW